MLCHKEYRRETGRGGGLEPTRVEAGVHQLAVKVKVALGGKG